MYLRKMVLFALSMIALPLMAENATNLCINEIMQSNIDNLMENKDFPDSWVELYNPTESDIDLYVYAIGQERDKNVKKPWYLSASHDVVIPAGGYIMIYCDKEGTNYGLHTNFRLDSGKGNLYLFNKSGQIIDSLSYKKMPAANVAYGRKTDGGDKWQYEVTPTPGAANESVGAKNVLPDPVFSVAGGIMNAPVTVTVSMPEGESLPEDTKLYITTNGQEPTKASQSGVSFTLNISQSTVVRAKLISDSALIARSVTHSYIYHPREVTMPIVSIVTDSTYMYSDSIGIWTGQETDSMPNYKQDWRRPINIEYFDGDSTWFNQVGETAIHGGASRNLAQKGLKVYANKRFGTKRYTGDFWEDKPNVKEVKSFILRCGGSACFFARISDGFAQKLFGTHLLNLDWQAYKPVLVYINGVYKGEYAMRERSDEDYVESNYDGLEDIEQADCFSSMGAMVGKAQPLYQHFFDTYTRNDVTYEEMAAEMDVLNFMEVLIAEMYSTNTDYPNNNVVFWRPTATDGKWRWILKDLDFIDFTEKQKADFNMFYYMFLTGDPSTTEYQRAISKDPLGQAHALYLRMISYPEFSELFADKMATYLGDFLKPVVAGTLLEAMQSEVRTEVMETFTMYGQNAKRFPNYIQSLQTFVANRPRYMYEHMAEFFNFGAVYPMTIAAEDYAVTMNDVPFTEGDFDGAYFENRALRLNAQADGKVWQATLTHADQSEQTLTFDSNNITVRLGDYAQDVQDTMQVHWELVETPTAGYEAAQPTVRQAQVYTVLGQPLPARTAGINIVRYSDGTIQKQIK